MKKSVSKAVLLGAASTIALTACGSGPSFAERDPKGYKACSDWADYKSRGDATSLVGGMMAVADTARGSATKDIRASVSNLFDQDTADAAGAQVGLLDADKFEAACKKQDDFDFTGPSK